MHISAVHFVSTLGGRGFPASTIDHPKYNLGSMLLGYTPDFVMLNDPQMVSDLDGTWMVLGWFMAVYDVPHHVYSDWFNCFSGVRFLNCDHISTIFFRRVHPYVCRLKCVVVGDCLHYSGFSQFLFVEFPMFFFNVYWYSSICLLKKLLYKQQ